VTISNVAALHTALDGALAAQQVVEAVGETRRYAGLDEARRARGVFTKIEAVSWLIDRGRSRSGAVWAARQLQDGFTDVPDTFGMTYDAPYWRVPVESDAGE
jgi:hypothetical protein